MLLKCEYLHIWKWSGFGPEAWPRDHYAQPLLHTLTLPEVFLSLKTHWPIRVSRRTSSEEEGSSGYHTASPALPLSRRE